jgi:pimeloyl-ACP methyl ester carboxylesterase
MRMHCVDEGSGPPVVLLHGNPTSSFYWRGLVAALRDRFRCVAPDHLGMGLSERPDPATYPFTLARRADDVAACLAALRVEGPFDLVVHDWGGMIGFLLAAADPGRVRRIVLGNTAAFRLPPGRPLPAELRLARAPLLGPLLVRGANAFLRGAVDRCASRPLAPDARAAYLAPFPDWASRASVHEFVRDIPLRPGDRSWEALERVEAALPALAGKPVLVLWGMRDFVFDAAFLAEWKRRFPGAEVHRFEGAGHWLLEDEGPACATLVRAFLLAGA